MSCRKVRASILAGKMGEIDMKRVGYSFLPLLAGVLFPILIWVALFAAIREPLLRALKRFAWAALGLLSGMVFPLLIWAGLGAAVKQRLQERMLQRRPRRTVVEVLASAGLSIQWETPGDQSMAAVVFVKLPVSRIEELLVGAVP